MTNLLSAQRVSKHFRGLRALSNFDMAVGQNEIVGLVGPNGAGKTTAFNVMSGVLPATSGLVQVMGRPTRGLRPHQIVRLGMARTFQATNVFKDATVFDNVLRGLIATRDIRLLGSVLRTAAYRRQEKDMQERAWEILQLVGLGSSARILAPSLPYGYQRLLGVAVALASQPRILLLDEPAAGLNPAEAQHMAEMIRRLHQQLGLSVLLVEHNMRMVMGLCHRLVVLQHGEIIARGSPEEIRHNPDVISAYLGRDDYEFA